MIPAKKYAEHLVRLHYEYSRCDNKDKFSRRKYAIYNALVSVRIIIKSNPVAFSANGTMYQTEGYWRDVFREITEFRNYAKDITHLSKCAKQHRIKNPYK